MNKIKLGVIVLISVGLVVSLWLVSQKQDNRNLAAGKCSESQATKCVLGNYFCGSGASLTGPFSCTTKTCSGNKCKTPVCSPGSVKCQGSGALYKCDSKGLNWVIFDNCASRTCSGNSCGVTTCKPGQRKCSGGKFQVCNSQGAWGNPQSCPTKACKDSINCR